MNKCIPIWQQYQQSGRQIINNLSSHFTPELLINSCDWKL